MLEHGGENEMPVFSKSSTITGMSLNIRRSATFSLTQSDSEEHVQGKWLDCCLNCDLFNGSVSFLTSSFINHKKGKKIRCLFAYGL